MQNRKIMHEFISLLFLVSDSSGFLPNGHPKSHKQGKVTKANYWKK